MHAKLLFLGAAAALQAQAIAAEEAKPRIYFPRHVKRQFTNTTTTSPEAFPPPESTPFTTRSESRDFISSFRSGLSELFSSEDGVPSTSTRPEEESTGRSGSVTTIIIESTIRVSPSSPTTTPGLSPPPPAVSTSSSSDESDLIDEPTSETSERLTSERDSSSAISPTEREEDETETTRSQETTSSSPIVIGPTGVVTSSDPTASASSERLSSADSSNSTESVSELPETTTTRLLDPILSPIASIISDILPSSIPANDTETETTLSTSDVAESTLVTTTTAEPTTTATSTSTGGSDLTDLISSLQPLPTLVEPSVSPNTTESDLPTTTGPVESSDTTLPPVESSPPVVTSEPPSSAPPGETLVPGNSTSSDPPEPTGSGSQEPTDLPSALPSESGIANQTSNVPEPSVLPTDLPTSSSVPSNGSDLVEPSSTIVPPVPTSSVVDLPATPSSSATTEATLTVPTESWMPTTIIIEQSTPTADPTASGATPTTPSTSTNLPKVISPEDIDDEQPEGTILLQVGFLYAENYEHVSNHPMAAAQIFSYLPLALAAGAGIEEDKVKVTRLVPFNTTASLGYITTLARFYYPEQLLAKLRMDVKIPNSLLYNHPTELVYNLTQQINPAIDIIPGQESEPGMGGGDGRSSDSPSGNNDILSNGESQSTPIQKGTAAAIGIGAVGVAAAYGAAMFLVARRYKQKKQAHRRSSSIANSSEMRYNGAGSPAMMGGALLSRDFTGYGGIAGGRDSHGSGRSGAGNSVRTAQISAPVAAENSLGWN